MLAALLLNPVVPPPPTPPPPVLASGPFRGFGTWNKDWSKKYGPDKDLDRREEKQLRREVVQAKTALAGAKVIPKDIQPAKAIAETTTVTELLADRAEASRILAAYHEYMAWRKAEEEIATILLLM